ncbi:MAG TPA: CHRD domain-containing protein [Nitrospiraceae bacterium]|nr:CHRD domain-containing protein [Nitrospiraceae bacterium]
MGNLITGQGHRKMAIAVFIMALLLAVQPFAYATTTFTSILTGSQETPPNASPATGFGTFVLNDPMTDLSFNVNYAGLIGGPIVGTHFHVAPIGVAGPIVRGLDITGATSPSGSFAGVWRSTDAQPLTPSLVNSLLANNIYFNIHTAAFPAGEIRGQLNAVPEPSTLLLLASGLGALTAYRKKKAGI